MKRYRYCGMCDKWLPARETECKACGMPTEGAVVGPVDGIRPHICGLSGIGFQCPACDAKAEAV